MFVLKPGRSRGGTPQHRGGRLWLLLAILALILGSVETASAQTFAEDISVTVVEVPVQVVRNGQPVRGLTRDDFVVYDRGVRRELVDFEVIDVGSIGEVSTVGRRDEAPSLPAAEVARGRHILLLFDFQFAPRWRLKRSVLGARGMVDRSLAKDDRLAVAMYTGSAGANILVGFTRDRDEIELGLSFVEALADGRRENLLAAREKLIEYWTGEGDAAGDEQAAARLRHLAARLGPSAAWALSDGTAGGEIMGLAEYDAISGDSPGGPARDGLGGSPSTRLVGPRIIDDRVAELEDLITVIENFSESMADLATLLRDVPNPKHLVYFSEGFPTEVLTNPQTQGRVLTRIRPATRAMQEAGWAIQAIDIEGVPDSLAATGRSAEHFEDPTPTEFITGQPRGELEPPGGRAGFDAEALAHLAIETGGLLMENFNDIGEAGNKILEATAVTYLLVFQPEDLVADGSFHKLEVKLASRIPGTRLHHRTGYSAPSPEADLTEVERRMDEARLVTGDDPYLGMRADSLVLSTPGDASAGARVSFLIDFDADDLLGERSAGKLELDLQAYGFGADDAIHDLLTQRLSLNLEHVEGRLRQGGLRLSGGLDLPPGRHRVRLIVRELGDGRVFARSHPVEIATAGETTALPPLILDPSREVLFVKVGPAGWEGLGVPLGDLVPAAGPRLPVGGERELLFVSYPPPGKQPRVAFRILTESGEPAEGAGLTWWEVLPDAGDGSHRLLGLLSAGSLTPGRYQLELSVGRGAGQAPVAVSTAFTVTPGPAG